MAARKTRLGFADTEFLKTARARFKFADDTDSEQRSRERDDLAFYAGDQWPADVRTAREGQQPTAGMPAVPARPTLVINNVREPVRQVSNEAASADLGIQIIPSEDFGDLGILPDTAEITLREGLVRKIQRESQARDARMWAYDRAVKAGRGYYQVLTRYLPGKTRDQEVYVHRIYNQAAVLLDPSHEEPDGSDAKWAFVCVDMLWDDYRAQFPNAADGRENRLALSVSDSEWQVLGDDYPKWFKTADDSGSKTTKVRAVRVVDYWYTEYESRDLCTLSDGSVVWKDELTELPASVAKRGKKIPARLDLPAGVAIVDTRAVTQQRIKFAKIDGAQVLEETDWAGPDMPIVKVMGEELQPYDAERRAEGMIRPARDSQMGLNYMISKQVETVGLTPIPPLMTDPDAIEGYETWYQLLNTRTLPYMPYRSYDDQGRPLKEPHRPNVEPNLLPIAQSIALFSAQIEKTTAVPAARLGDIDPVTRSGKALDRLTANSKNSTGNFLLNLIRSVRYEGQIENNLLYPIYGSRPGRLVRILVGNGAEHQLVMVHDAPQAATANPQMAALLQRASAVATLTPDATFNITIKVTRDFDTRQEEEHQTLAQLIGADPQFVLSTMGDLFFKSMTTPGKDEMAQRAKVMLAPAVQQFLAAQAQGQQPPSPRELALQGQLQQLQHALQQAAMEKQGKVLEGQMRLQQTTVQEAAETQRSREKNETTITVAELSALAKELQDTRALFMEERARIGAQIHEAGQANLDRQHDDQQNQAQQMQDARMAAHGASMQDIQQVQQSAQPTNGNGAA